MGIHVNFADAPQSGAPDTGSYPVRITKCEESISANSGKPMIVVDLKITDGEFEGRNVRSFMSLQPNALFTLKRFLQALDYDTSESLDFEPDDIINRELTIAGVKELIPGEDSRDPENYRFNIKKFSPL